MLINEYTPGQGIMPHEDGDAYAPVVATVSLGASICLDILPKLVACKKDHREEVEVGSEPEEDGHLIQEEEGEFKLPTRIYQEPRSLLVTTGTAYRSLLHGIEEIEVDDGLDEKSVVNWRLLGDRTKLEATRGSSRRETRVSLTYRDVLNVSAAAKNVFGGLTR